MLLHAWWKLIAILLTDDEENKNNDDARYTDLSTHGSIKSLVSDACWIYSQPSMIREINRFGSID